MIKVKVCGMREYRNIIDVSDAGPDYLGFIFYQGSKRYVGADPDRVLFQQVRTGVKKVGVLVNEQPEKILELATRYGIEIIQLHGEEPPECCGFLRNAGFEVIKVFGMDKDFSFTRLVPYIHVCDYFLFDTKSPQHGGTGLKFNWEKLKQYEYDIPFFLSGGIGPNDAGIIRHFSHPALVAVDINSRFEIEPGLKDVNQIKTFIKEIKTTEP